MRCLVTKLEGVVNDLSLKRMGEIRIEINANGGESFKITRPANTLGDLYVATLDGEARISDTNGGTLVSEIIVPNLTGGANKTIYLSSGQYTLRLLHKDNLGEIQSSNASFMTLHGEEWSSLASLFSMSLSVGIGGFDISYLRNYPNLNTFEVAGQNCVGALSDLLPFKKLQKLQLNKTAITGDIAVLNDFGATNAVRIISCKGITGDAMSALSNKLTLQTVSFEGTPVQGNLASIKDLTALKTLHINGTNIVGDLSNLGKMLNLTSFQPSNNMTGTIESMVAAFRSNGKKEGVFTLSYAAGITGATFEGLSINNWLKANGGKSSLKLTWTETTITGESV
jgi:hypothetical protein